MTSESWLPYPMPLFRPKILYFFPELSDKTQSSALTEQCSSEKLLVFRENAKIKSDRWLDLGGGVSETNTALRSLGYVASTVWRKEEQGPNAPQEPVCCSGLVMSAGHKRWKNCQEGSQEEEVRWWCVPWKERLKCLLSVLLGFLRWVHISYCAVQTKARSEAMKAWEETFEMDLPSFSVSYLGSLVTAVNCVRRKRAGKMGRGQDVSCRLTHANNIHSSNEEWAS